MIYDLPTTVEVGGVTYKIRSDYRAILDICMALTDPDLDAENKVHEMITIFYADEVPYKDWDEAVKKCLWFINLGNDDKRKKGRKLMDWKQDFQFIVAPINRVLGAEIRAVEYLHWWTFIGAYYEIGDCTFAQIVRIRDLKAKGKLKDKADKEWYRDNRELVDLKTTYSQAENDLLKMWGGVNGEN